MPRYKTINYHEPLLVAVDYVVSGPRTAAAVAADRSRLTGMNYQTAEGGLQSVESNDIAGVLQSLGPRPRLYNDALFGLAVEAQNDLPSPSDVADIDDLRTMLCLLFGGDPSGNQELAIDGGERVRVAFARVNNPLALCARLSQQIAVAHLHDLYREIELPVLAPVLTMTLGGLRVNRPVLEGIAASSETQMEIARRQVQEIAGGPINLDSSPELIHYLYEELRLPVPAYTANGNPSTSNKALQAQRPSIQQPLPSWPTNCKSLSETRQPRCWPILGPMVLSMPNSIHWARPPADSVAAPRTCRASPPLCFLPSKPRPVACSWRPTIRKWNCGCWPTSPKMPLSFTPSSTTSTCTCAPRPACWASPNPM